MASSSSGENGVNNISPLDKRLKELYPQVNEVETPLPRSWSPKDKFNFIGLSQNNLRVHYKGKFVNYPREYCHICGIC